MQKIASIFGLGVTLLLGACAQQGPVTSKTPVVLFPPLPQQPRIQFLTVIATEDSLNPNVNKGGFREFVVGTEESRRVERLVRPFALGHSPGLLYVLDKKKKLVTRIDLPTGKFSYLDDMSGGLLIDPNSIFVDKDGSVYVADMRRQEIIVYDSRGAFDRSYATGDNSRPVDVAATDDRLYVVDINGAQVVIFDKLTGERLDSFGGPGMGDGLFQRPTHLALTADGRVAVTDMMNFRVQLFDADGSYLNKYGEPGTGRGAVVRPKGMSIDRAGNMYLADFAFEMISIFDLETGTPRMVFGKAGLPGGAYMPQDTLVDYDNVDLFRRFTHPYLDLQYLIYVANGWNAISVYGFGEWTGPLDVSAAKQLTGDDSVLGGSTLPALEELEDEPEP